MAVNNAGSIMSGGTNMKHFASNAEQFCKYALFLGGTNVTNEVLAQYDPIRTGYGRLFMVRTPKWMANMYPDETKIFKHMLEYGNTAVQGINDVSVDFDSIQGGYVGKSFEIPKTATNGTTEFNVKVYDFSGSPIRKYLHAWINGTTDLLTGLTTYHGDVSIERKQSNQTAEFIYVATDNTGERVEYACLLANCFPKQINTDVFNYTAGEHGIVETEIPFTCTLYESININKVACRLIEKYKILANSLNFFSGFTDATSGKGSIMDERGNFGTYYNDVDGTITQFKQSNDPTVSPVSFVTASNGGSDISNMPQSTYNNAISYETIPSNGDYNGRVGNWKTNNS
jgi:hypothetical protein